MKPFHLNQRFSTAVVRAFAVMTAFLLAATAASAATFTVNQAGDAGDGTCDATCTLRDAITAANTASFDDVINFAPSINNITLTNEIVISAVRGKLDINGNGADTFTIDGGAGQNRIFFSNGATLSLTNMTLTGGNGFGASFNTNGGAIYQFAGALSLDRVHITGNTATTGGPAAGIFFFQGTHRIINSTFSGNTTTTSCGAFYNSGGNITVVNSTFSNNTAKTGGAICNAGNLTLRDTTVAGNTGSLGGAAIYQDSSSTLTFGNTIIAANIASSGNPEITFNAGTIISEGNNLVGDSAGDAANTTKPIAYQPSDILDTAPLLGSLQTNGGSTPTLALLAGSPAIDKGNNALAADPSNSNSPLNADQRFYRRIIDGNADGAATVDIGAYEYNSTVQTVANIFGRATGFGRPTANVVITLKNSAGQIIAVTITSNFGYYRFLNVPIGSGYTLEAKSKPFVFSPQTVNLSGNAMNINFTA